LKYALTTKCVSDLFFFFPQWHEKDMDDIRETIINYEDEGGGERDTGMKAIKVFLIEIFLLIKNFLIKYRLRSERSPWSSNLRGQAIQRSSTKRGA
jgi:Cadherin cytoplasmic region